jgi:hypothetical protein
LLPHISKAFLKGSHGLGIVISQLSSNLTAHFKDYPLKPRHKTDPFHKTMYLQYSFRRNNQEDLKKNPN